MRLDKYLAQMSMGTRSEVKKFIKSGRVFVNGAPASGPEQKVTEEDNVELDGEKVSYEKYVYYMLNKPQGVVSATKDNTCRTVLSLITDSSKKDIFPVGRLDKDTSGMLLLTNDGAFSHALLAPKRHVPKYYRMQLARPYEESYAQQLAEGLVLADGTHCLPAEILPVLNTDRMAVICLHEGKYHQVRRMLAAVGNHVEQLQRVAIGNLFLPIGLQIGACQKLTSTQISLLSQQPDPKFLWELTQNSNF